MEKERHTRKRSSRREVALNSVRILGLSAAVALTQPIVEPVNSYRVGKHLLMGQEIECIKSIEEQAYPFDAIAVPGAGSMMFGDEYIPGPFGQLRLEAAAIAYARGMAPRIILLDGASRNGKDGLVNKIFLEEMLEKQKASVTHETIIKQENDRTINTATGMEALGEITETYKMRNIMVMTNEFHGARAAQLACAHGVNARSFSAEDVIINADPSRASEIWRLYSLDEMERIRQKELLELVWALGDSRGEVPTLVRHAELLLR